MVFKVLTIVLLYYSLSIGLTFYQKWFIKNYKLPLLVVSCHYLLKWLSALFIRWLYECCNTRICASLDIGLSNWALEYVTVSLYTMAKSSSILFIVAFSLLLRLERWRTSLGVEAAFIASGLFLFTWQSSQLDFTGLLLVELAASCTGIRWTVSQLVMQRDEHAVRNPLDMVAHVQPWMFIPIIPLVVFFEGPQLSYETVFYYKGIEAPYQVLLLTCIGGLLAFCMELSEYLLLVNTSGITLNIFGIVKEITTLLLAHMINNDKLTSMNSMGLVLCFTGMLIHAFTRRRQRSHMSKKADDSTHMLLEADDMDA